MAAKKASETPGNSTTGFLNAGAECVQLLADGNDALNDALATPGLKRACERGPARGQGRAAWRQQRGRP